MDLLKRCVALVGGEADIVHKFSSFLRDANFSVDHLKNPDSLTPLLRRETFDAVFLAPALSAVEIRQALTEVGAICATMPVVVLAADSDLSAAAEFVRCGATDTLRVPFTREELLFCVRKVLLIADHAEEQAPTTAAVNLDTQSAEMKQALGIADRAARSMTTVLIRGESGVGKEVFARRIHQRSNRAAGPFIKIHCAALPEQILESELFGYERGAFTGAVNRKAGRFELAEGGTIFLDEIGDISPAVQVKLLRILQDREFERLGGTQSIKADVRVVAATHRNLERMLKSHEFREDLYYRLNVLPIQVPPLRARPDHVAALARHFCKHFATLSGRQVGLSDAAVEVLLRASWPGNVRQLQNILERLVVLSESSEISGVDVSSELARDGSGSVDEWTNEPSAIELSLVVQKAERRALRKALDRAEGNRTTAARLLGVSRRTLFYKLREHKLD